MEGREEEEAQEALDAEGIKVRFKRLHRYLGGFTVDGKIWRSGY